MLSKFNFDTPIERAYAQAMRWDARRLWRRCRLTVRRKDFASGCAQLLALAHKYATCFRRTELHAQTIDSLLQLLKHTSLEPSQKLSLCRVCAIIVRDLFDRGETTSSPYVFPLIGVITDLILSVGKPGLEVVGMLQELSKIYERPVPLSEIMFLDATIRVRIAMDRANEFLPDNLSNDTPEIAAAGDKRLEDIKKMPPSAPRSNEERPPVPATRAERLAVLRQDLALAIEVHGLHSPQGTAAVVRLAQFHVSSQEQENAVESLKMLAEIISDYSVEMDKYQLREIHTLAGKMQDCPDATELIQKLEQEALTRKEMLVGFDSNITADLFRLAKLWERTGTLQDAHKFCNDLLIRAANKLDANGLVFKQIKSAEHRIRQMLRGENPIPSTAADLRSGKYAGPEEFVFMIALSAFDKVDTGDITGAANTLNELLVYHNDCISDDARRVREMLWLLVESKLRHAPQFVADLLKCTPRGNPELGPVDEYNESRYLTHSKRLAKLNHIDELIKSREISNECLHQTNIALVRVLPNISRAHLEQFNDLASSTVDHLVNKNFCDEAKTLLRLLLAMNIQTHEYANRIRVRMAEICIDQGELFEGCAIIYSAFCDIPDGGEESKPIGPGDSGTNLLEMR